MQPAPARPSRSRAARGPRSSRTARPRCGRAAGLPRRARRRDGPARWRARAAAGSAPRRTSAARSQLLPQLRDLRTAPTGVDQEFAGRDLAASQHHRAKARRSGVERRERRRVRHAATVHRAARQQRPGTLKRGRQIGRSTRARHVIGKVMGLVIDLARSRFNADAGRGRPAPRRDSRARPAHASASSARSGRAARTPGPSPA